MSAADDGGAGEPEKQSHLYKVAFAAYSCDLLRRSTQPRAQVLVIGDYAVGKTSLIKRYTEGIFTPNYKLTIGVDFAVKTLEWDDENTVNLQLWDVAGHERFGTMTRVYYKYAIAAVIVFDLQRHATFEAVLKWREDVNNKVVLANDEPIPCILLANKCDLEPVDDAALDEFCREHNFAGWFATSAATDQGIDEAMNFLVTKILEVARANRLPEPDSGAIDVGHGGAEHDLQRHQQKSDCCN